MLGTWSDRLKICSLIPKAQRVLHELSSHLSAHARRRLTRVGYGVAESTCTSSIVQKTVSPTEPACISQSCGLCGMLLWADV